VCKKLCLCCDDMCVTWRHVCEVCVCVSERDREIVCVCVCVCMRAQNVLPVLQRHVCGMDTGLRGVYVCTCGCVRAYACTHRAA